MTVWLAGMRITADRLNDYSLDSETTSGLTAATDFTTVSFYGRRSKGTVTIDEQLTYGGATITAADGQIPDTDICTLPAGWRPQHDTISASWGDGVESGELICTTGGVCTLRSSDGDIEATRNIRFQLVFNLD
jgi:hypothetical protein